MPSPVAIRITDQIVRDLWDRSMLGNAWEQIAPKTRGEIQQLWADIIDKEIASAALAPTTER